MKVLTKLNGRNWLKGLGVSLKIFLNIKVGEIIARTRIASKTCLLVLNRTGARRQLIWILILLLCRLSLLLTVFYLIKERTIVGRPLKMRKFLLRETFFMGPRGVMAEERGEVNSINTENAIVVHTEGGPTLLSTSLWSCLHTPLKNQRTSDGQELSKDLDHSSQDKITNPILKGSGKGCVISGDMVGTGRDMGVCLADNLQHAESDRDSAEISDTDRVIAVWRPTKKRRVRKID